MKSRAKAQWRRGRRGEFFEGRVVSLLIVKINVVWMQLIFTNAQKSSTIATSSQIAAFYFFLLRLLRVSAALPAAR